MFSKSSLSLIFVASLLSISKDAAFALQITDPSQGASWNASQPLTVKWTSVQSDPTTFEIQLTNNDANTSPTSSKQVIKKDVSTSDGSYTINSLKDVKEGSGYQINFVNGANGGILAQSPQFNITSVGSNYNTTNNSSVQTVVNSTTSTATLPNGTTTSTMFNSTNVKPISPAPKVNVVFQQAVVVLITITMVLCCV